MQRKKQKLNQQVFKMASTTKTAFTDITINTLSSNKLESDT